MITMSPGMVEWFRDALDEERKMYHDFWVGLGLDGTSAQKAAGDMLADSVNHTAQQLHHSRVN